MTFKKLQLLHHLDSKNAEEHGKHITAVFERLKKFNMSINIKKCVFGHTSIEFLGHKIDSRGISPLDKKIEAIRDFPKPKIAKELRSFIAMINFYRRFLPNAMETQLVLQSMLNGNKKNDTTLLVWTPEKENAFNKFKDLLINSTLLSFPVSNAKIVLAVDASDKCIGGTLNQLIDNQLQPLGFFSRKLSNAQLKYSTYDRELLAIYAAIKYFKFMLEGRVFTIYSDHKPLIFAFKQKLDKASPRQLRQLDFISQFSTDIQHIRGTDNIVPDILSRIESIENKSINYEIIASQQDTDSELKQILEGKSKCSVQLNK